MAPTMHHCLSSRAPPPPSPFCELALKFAEWKKAQGGGRRRRKKERGGQQASDCDRRGAQTKLASSVGTEITRDEVLCMLMGSTLGGAW